MVVTELWKPESQSTEFEQRAGHEFCVQIYVRNQICHNSEHGYGQTNTGTGRVLREWLEQGFGADDCPKKTRR